MLVPYRPNIPVVLTIAGSDSSGGAGIQADLKTITALGGYGASVITALTAQNTCGVFDIFAPSASFVAKELEVVLEDLPVKAIKTGMLFKGEIIKKIASILKESKIPLVVDPVCVSQSGHKLLQDEAIEVLKQELLPLATLLTPNGPETEILTGIKLSSPESYEKCFQKFWQLGCKAVLLKGGHFITSSDLEVVDILGLSDGKIIKFKGPRIDTANNHGTGCTLSAALATFLARGYDLLLSIEKAREFLTFSLKHSFPLGKGSGPVNHLAWGYKYFFRQQIREELLWLKDRLEAEKKAYKLVPEVRMNIVRLAPYAEGMEDVAGFDGRISVDKRKKLIFGQVDFNVSSHMAKVILTAAKYDANLVLAANIRYSPEILQSIEKAGFEIFYFNRKDEPKEIKEKEGSSLEWGVEKVFLENPGKKIEFIADPGEIGKEPMIRLLAFSKEDMWQKIKKILEIL